MERFVFVLLFLTLVLGLTFLWAGDNPQWKVEKGIHTVVYYNRCPQDFVRRVIDSAERYYEEITAILGFIRYNFWLWEDRAQIFIHDSAKDYQLATQQPHWSAGVVEPKRKIIHTYIGDEGFLGTVLPHELAHIIFREFVGMDNPVIPSWLEEGVACYQENSRRDFSRQIVKQALLGGYFIQLLDLGKINPQRLKDEKQVELFYAEAVQVLDYLLGKFGREKFVYFCQILRDEKDLDKALRQSYGFESLSRLSESWEKFLRNE